MVTEKQKSNNREFAKAIPNIGVNKIVGTTDGINPEWVEQTGGAAVWGGITGTLSDQTDLQAELDAKQATLVSATNIKTINGSTILGAGDLVVGGVDATKLAILNNLSDLNNAGTARTNIGLDTTANQTDSSNKRFVTDAQLTVIGNTSNTNSGDNAVNILYSGLAASKQDADAQLTSLAALSYAGNTLKVVRVNAGETDFELATISGSGLAQYQVRQLIRR